mmetsp:Transcript_57687/g.162659  ORF Transcript_57687/g.162659 Transcript_57687/m.162659 type:complete len:664 (-) Transcript_57687:170-2161(-)
MISILHAIRSFCFSISSFCDTAGRSRGCTGGSSGAEAEPGCPRCMGKARGTFADAMTACAAMRSARSSSMSWVFASRAARRSAARRSPFSGGPTMLGGGAAASLLVASLCRRFLSRPCTPNSSWLSRLVASRCATRASECAPGCCPASPGARRLVRWGPRGRSAGAGSFVAPAGLQARDSAAFFSRPDCEARSSLSWPLRMLLMSVPPRPTCPSLCARDGHGLNSPFRASRLWGPTRCALALRIADLGPSGRGRVGCRRPGSTRRRGGCGRLAAAGGGCCSRCSSEAGTKMPAPRYTISPSVATGTPPYAIAVGKCFGPLSTSGGGNSAATRVPGLSAPGAGCGPPQVAPGPWLWGDCPGLPPRADSAVEGRDPASEACGGSMPGLCGIPASYVGLPAGDLDTDAPELLAGEFKIGLGLLPPAWARLAGSASALAGWNEAAGSAEGLATCSGNSGPWPAALRAEPTALRSRAAPALLGPGMGGGALEEDDAGALAHGAGSGCQQRPDTSLAKLNLGASRAPPTQPPSPGVPPLDRSGKPPARRNKGASPAAAAPLVLVALSPTPPPTLGCSLRPPARRNSGGSLEAAEPPPMAPMSLISSAGLGSGWSAAPAGPSREAPAARRVGTAVSPKPSSCEGPAAELLLTPGIGGGFPGSSAPAPPYF